MSTCKPSPTLITEESFSTVEQSDYSSSSSSISNDAAAADVVATPPPAMITIASTTTNRNTTTSTDRQGWWQKSVVRRSVAAVQNQVNTIVDNSPFLQDSASNVNNHHDEHIALFHRREIRTGRLIGSGGFSEVYEITGFDLDPSVSDRCSPSQQELRVECAATACVMASTDDNSNNNSAVVGRFALKHLKRRLVHSPKDFTLAATDLAMEAAYMSALDHPNILAVRGLPIDGLAAFAENGDHDGYFLMTDRLTGTLGDRIRDWKTTSDNGVSSSSSSSTTPPPPTLKEKAGYALQIASALRYLHNDCRIVFRDLKPHNMGFCANTGTVQLFDFGLCRELPAPNDDENNNNGSSNDGMYEMSGVGTRRYMAPEIINAGRYNTKVDVYSWAMVTWELLTGCKPYHSYGTDEHRVAVCQGGERPRLRLDWPQWLHKVLRHTWCESVADRWSMDHVVVHLQRALREPLSPKQPRRSSYNTNSLLDSPAGVHEFSNSPDFPSFLSVPDLRGVTTASVQQQQRRRISLNPRFLTDDDDDDTSSLFASVMDSSLLGLTLCLDEGIEVCANGNTLTLSPTTSGQHCLLPRRRIVPMCTI